MQDVNNIITLTDAAIQHIKQIMSQKNDAAGFRISIKQTGCSGYMYQPEIIATANQNDISFDMQGLSVFIDPNCIDIIQGTKIDYVTKSFGAKQLEYNNPHADGLCGCGESFHLRKDLSE